MTATWTRRPVPRTRRDVLRAGALALLGVPLAAACTSGYEEGPDPLAPLIEQARADARAAEALAGSLPAKAELVRQVAAARTAQGDALQSEVDRQNQPKSDTPPVTHPHTSGLDVLKQRLASSRRNAEQLVATVPSYRAGLVGSVAAGCAALQVLSPELDADSADAVRVEAPRTGQLPVETVQALQQALDTEHAAVWVYGLASAFLPGDFAKGIDNGSTEHTNRRDACQRVLIAAGTSPDTAEPAYVPPQQVTDAKSAMTVVAIAEADVTVAWRGVLERTDDAGLRSLASLALIGSARRGTRWRVEIGARPAAIELPGQPSTKG